MWILLALLVCLSATLRGDSADLARFADSSNQVAKKSAQGGRSGPKNGGSGGVSPGGSTGGSKSASGSVGMKGPGGEMFASPFMRGVSGSNPSFNGGHGAGPQFTGSMSSFGGGPGGRYPLMGGSGGGNPMVMGESVGGVGGLGGGFPNMGSSGSGASQFMGSGSAMSNGVGGSGGPPFMGNGGNGGISPFMGGFMGIGGPGAVGGGASPIMPGLSSGRGMFMSESPTGMGNRPSGGVRVPLGGGGMMNGMETGTLAGGGRFPLELIKMYPGSGMLPDMGSSAHGGHSMMGGGMFPAFGGGTRGKKPSSSIRGERNKGNGGMDVKNHSKGGNTGGASATTKRVSPQPSEQLLNGGGGKNAPGNDISFGASLGSQLDPGAANKQQEPFPLMGSDAVNFP